MTYHTKSAPRLSGSILYTLIAVFSLTLITACGGGGLKLEANLNITDARTELCKANPYATACRNDENYDAARKEVFDNCIADSTADLCATVIPIVCDDNPFSALCADNTEYETARGNIITACDALAPECTPAIRVHFCTDNPYHARCDDPAYHTNRADILATCSTNPDGTNTGHRHCDAAVEVCKNNPFDALCLVGDNYTLVRTSTINICIDDNGPGLTSQFCANAIEATCVGEGITDNPVLCANAVTGTVAATCDINIWDSVCDDSPTYIGQRIAHCTTDKKNDPRCDPLILSVCTFTPSTDDNNDNSTGNPFAALCQSGTTYETPRNTIITACTADLRGRLCPNATEHACGINPFHALCYDSSATAFQAARQTAVNNCGDGTNIITTQLCADAVQQTCEGDSADTFNALCGAYSGQAAQVAACGDNDAATRCYLQEQIDRCADGRETDRCAQVGTGDISTCAADPFAAACVANGSTFATYLVDAQEKRYAYCDGEGVSATDPICASFRACGSTTPTPAGCGSNFDATLLATCEATPFVAQCASDVFNDNKVAFCRINAGGVNNLFHGSCTADYRDDTLRNSFCEDNPFDANCNNNIAYADDREENCAGNTPHASCVTPAIYTNTPTGPTALADTAKYADSFLAITVTDDSDPTTPIIGAIKETVITPAVTVTDPVPDGSPDGTQPITRITTPETTTEYPTTIGFRTVGRRGGAGSDASPNKNKDGFVYFKLERARLSGDTTSLASTRISTHAALLPTTNLGAPLRAAPTTAVWPGHFRTTATVDPTAVDFYIDFAARRVGFSSPTRVGIGHHLDTNPNKNHAEDRPSIARISNIRIDVRWWESGALYGFIEIHDDDDDKRDALIVNGLIGQEGLVAVGYSNANKGGAGGFTASNPDHPTYVPAFVEADANDEETDSDSNASLVNYEDWTESGIAPSATPSDPRISELLQTTTFIDKTRGFASLASGANAQIGDFNSATNFRSLLSRGDAKNGFAVKARDGNFYAGVLHTADLGAPVTQSAGSAIWRGYVLAQDGTATTHRLFDLTVTFSSNHEGQVGTLSGDILNDRNVTTGRSALLYSIDGRFNARGVISGDIRRSVAINTVERTFTTSLSGLIGQKGAIAVFASNHEESKFAGGFVARPSAVTTVNYDVWVRTTPLTTGGLEATPKGYNHWLKGGVAGSAGGLNGQSREGVTLDANGVGSGILRLSDATYKLAPIGGSANDGVAFYTGIHAIAKRRQFYSGLFAETDLGKPVARTSGSAEWVGQLAARQHIGGGIHHRYGDIVLRVNFTPTGGTITGGLNANKFTSPGYSYDLANVTFNEDGFVRGNVNTRTTSGGREEGFLTGLIGEEGLVGSFVAPNVSGGLVAVPTVPAFAAPQLGRTRWGTGGVVDYQYWHRHIQNTYGGVHLPHNETGRLNEFLVTDPGDPNHFISYGNSRSDDGRERIAVRVEDAWSDQLPTGLTGGFSALHTLWNARDGLGEKQTGLHRAYHAGIHPDTNVGTILPVIPDGIPGVVVTWKARMSIIGNKTFDYQITTGSVSPIDVTNVEFDLQVHTGNRTLRTPRHTATYQTINGHWYELLADWDERGVITGTFKNSHADFPNADVTGLIGTNGAVAAIVSQFNRTYGYAGGFIACPTYNENRSQNRGGSGSCAR